MDINDAIATVQVMIHDDESNGLDVTRLEEVASLLEELAQTEDAGNAAAGEDTVAQAEEQVAEAELVEAETADLV